MEQHSDSNKWFVLNAKARIDSFNQNALRDQLRRAMNSGHRQIALDLQTTRFLSLAAIQFLVQFAAELGRNGGKFALLSPAERTKRHFEIYGSLNSIEVIRNRGEIQIGQTEDLGPDTAKSDYESEPFAN